MRRVNVTGPLVALLGIAAVAAVVAATAGGRPLSASGDTCTASGSGTTYAASITIPAGAPDQYGFAFGGSGGHVKSVMIQQTGPSEGSFSQANLPHGATGAWISLTPLQLGNVIVANLVTTAAFKGSLSVLPASAAQPQPAYFDPIQCAIAPAKAVASAFTIDPKVTYDAVSKAWHMNVTIGGAGWVSAVQPRPTVGTGSVQSTAKALVQTHKVGLKSAGKLTLTIRPTSLGSAALASKGALKLKLSVTFDPNDGRSASKVVSVTLAK